MEAPKSYSAPSITVLGGLSDLTLTSNKYEVNTPDGTIYHPTVGPPVVLTS